MVRGRGIEKIEPAPSTYSKSFRGAYNTEPINPHNDELARHRWWQEESKCQQLCDGGSAFPDMWDTSYAPQKMAEKISYAQNVCSDCPVQQMCAKWYYEPTPEGVIVAGIPIPDRGHKNYKSAIKAVRAIADGDKTPEQASKWYAEVAHG